jgi:hypothetical protein
VSDDVNDRRSTRRRWYARLSDLALYEEPAATAAQRQRAESLLHDHYRASVDDRDAHRGALDMLRTHLAMLHDERPTVEQLLPAVELSCGVRGLTDDGLLVPGEKPKWEWIDPRRIVHDGLGKPFKPYHYTRRGLAAMAVRIVAENGDPAGLLALFGGPIETCDGVVVNRLEGPLGPVHVLSVNGLHRTAALRALRAPVILAEVHEVGPPYRLHIRDDETQRETLDFLRWLEAEGAIRLGRRPVVTTAYSRYICVVEAEAPFLLGPPAEALAAIDTYEAIVAQQVSHFGPLHVDALRAEWSHARHRRGVGRTDTAIVVSVEPFRHTAE